jgi:hypothetical protein
MNRIESKLKFMSMLTLASLFRREHSHGLGLPIKKTNLFRTSKFKRHQGEREKARRRRQIADGRIPQAQILHHQSFIQAGPVGKTPPGPLTLIS